MRKLLLFLSIFLVFAGVCRAADITEKWTFGKGNPTGIISLGSSYTDESQYLPDGWYMMSKLQNQSKPYYYIDPNFGQDGLPALKGVNPMSSTPSKDVIVLPVKAGKVLFNLKLSDKTYIEVATIRLYNVTKSGDTWTLGSQIADKEFSETSTPAISRNGFTLVSFDVPTDGYIGFVLGNLAYILDVRNTYQGASTTYSVSGTVVDDENNPVGDAKVSIQGKSALTAADGTFSVPEVSEGEGTLTVSKEGYTGTTQTVTVSGADLTGVKVVLTPIVSGVKGYLMDDNLAKLVAPAKITITDDSGKVYATAETTAVNPNYEMTFKGAVPASLKVNIESDYYTSTSITWAPTVGQIYQRNFVINRKRLNPVVAVKDASGNAVTGAAVTMTAKDDASETLTFAESSTQGSYTYTARPYFYAHQALDKQYVVTVTHADYKDYTSDAFAFSGNDKTVNAVLEAYGPTVFKGYVWNSIDNQPLAGVNVSLSLPDTPTAVASTEAGVDGAYTLSVQGALADRYVLSFTTDDFENRTVDIKAPQRGTIYVNNIVMQAVMLTFTAKVQNASGEAIADAKLNFNGKDLEAAEGVFTTQVPAYASYWDEYDVKVSANGYEPLETKVIFNGESVDKTFTLEESMLTFTAKVQNAAGDLITDAIVEFDGNALEAADGVYTAKVGVVTSAGKSYAVVVSAPGYQAVNETVQFDGQSVDKTFTLEEQTVKFTACVNDADGNSLDGATVTISDGQNSEELTAEGNGIYSIEYGMVTAGNTQYTVTIVKDGYVSPEPFTFSFNGEDVSRTFLLQKEAGISSIFGDADGELRVYDLTGRRIAVENLSELRSGIYVVNGVKIAIR